MDCLLISSPKSISAELTSFFKSNRVYFETIPNALAGIQRAQKHHFDVIVMDSKSHGVKIDQAIRLLKGFDPRVRIIVQTEHNSKNLETRVRKEQIFYYHVISFGTNELTTAISAALGLTPTTTKRTMEEAMQESTRILLVDDDQDFVAINTTILETKGYQVRSASHPQEAWQIVKEWQPHLICLDIMMPTGTEGFHFAYKIRSYEATRDVPILMISSIHDYSDFRFSPEEDGDFMPVEEFLEKPIRPEVLLQKVEHLLQQKAKSEYIKSDKGIGLKKD